MSNIQKREKNNVSLFCDGEKFAMAQRTAKLLSSSELVPQMYRATPGNENKALANCLIAMETAERIGASPLMVMQNMYIVHGQPAWSSKFLIATVNASGRFTPLAYEFPNKNSCRCFAYDITDVKKEKPLYGAWVTVEMAAKEGWSTKKGSKWQTIPQLMLQYRAATFWARTYAPELSMGIKTADEVRDIQDVQYTDVSNEVQNSNDIEIERISVMIDDSKTIDDLDVLKDSISIEDFGENYETIINLIEEKRKEFISVSELKQQELDLSNSEGE